MILLIAKMQVKRPYIIHPRIDAFSCDIRAVCTCSGVNIKLESSVTEKRPPFLALADLRKFLGNYSLSAAPSM
jgi:hypothetical protein